MVIVGLVLVPLCALFLSGCMPSSESIQESETLVQEAQDLVSASRYADALSKYSAAHEIDEGNADIYSGVAQIYLLKNRFQDAKDILDDGIRRSRNPSYVYLYRGKIAYEDGDYDEAVTYLRNAVAKDGTNYEARILLAKTYCKEGSFDTARKQLTIPEDGGDWYVRAQLMKAVLSWDDIDDIREIVGDLSRYTGDDEDLDRAVAAFNDVIEKLNSVSQKESDGYSDALLAYAALEVGCEDIVIEKLTEYADDTSEYWELYLYLGRAHYMAGNIQNAADYLSIAVSLQSSDPYGPWMLARVYGQLGKDTEMELHYERAISLSKDTERITVREEYAQVLLENGQYASAERQFRLLQSDNAAAKDMYNLMMVETLVERGILDEASKMLEGVMVSELDDEQTARYYWADAVIQNQLGERDTALIRIDQAITYDDITARYHVLRGQIYFELGEEDKAKIALERAIDLDLEGNVSAEAEKILDRM